MRRPWLDTFNTTPDIDGVMRSLPLLAEYKGQYYESLALAMFRRLAGSPSVVPVFSDEQWLSRRYQGLNRILLKEDKLALFIPVDKHISTLVPYRGLGGVKVGSFRYVSAADVLAVRRALASWQP